MDAEEVAALRALLEGTPLDDDVVAFATTLGTAPQPAGGLLVVGTPADEPWHFTAHLSDEARWSERPDLDPTLVRWHVPASAPAHLAVGVDRLAAVRRRETLVVVAPGRPPERLLDRLSGARKRGALVLAIDAAGDADLHGLAHESLVVPSAGTYLEVVTHVVSQTAPTASRGRASVRDRLGRLLDRLQGAPEVPRPRRGPLPW